MATTRGTTPTPSGDERSYQDDSGPVVPTHDLENDTLASPQVSTDSTSYASDHVPPAPREEEESWPTGGGKWPTPHVEAYESDEGPVVATHDAAKDTQVDWDELNPAAQAVTALIFHGAPPMIERRWGLSLLMGLLLLLLVGCGSNVGLSLYEGGEWEYSSLVSLSPEQDTGAQGEEIRELIAEQWQGTEGQPVTFETKREVKKDAIEYRSLIHGTDFAQMAPYLSEPEAKATVRQNDDGTISLTIPLTVQDGGQSILFPTEGLFEFNLNAGQIISSNATKAEAGKATWNSDDIRARGLTEIAATVRPGQRQGNNLPLLIGGGLLGLLLLLALGFVVTRGRKRARPTEAVPAGNAAVGTTPPPPPPPVQRSPAPPEERRP